MNYIPAIYFSVLTLYLLKERGIDASTYISLLYTVTSVLAIGIDVMGLNPNLVSFASMLPTILYCLLLTLFILPAAIVDFNSYEGLVVYLYERVLTANLLPAASYTAILLRTELVTILASNTAMNDGVKGTLSSPVAG